MKKYAVVLVVVGLLVLNLATGVFASDLAWEDIGRGNLNLKTVLVEPENPNVIYIGSDKGIFKSEDGAKTWRNILSVRGQNRVVNFLLFEPKDKNSLYAATQGGLFYSSNQGKSWNRIFQGKNYLEDECRSVAVLSEAIYLGTKGGLFVSKDKGRSWYKQAGTVGSSNILAIAYNLREPSYIYVACSDGIFKTQNRGESWERVFVAKSIEENDNNDVEEEIEDEDKEQGFSHHIRYITLDPNNLNYLYLATSRGIYKSQDRGGNWESVSSYGLLNRDVKFLLISNKSHIYAVTKSGLFEYINDRWYELSFNLAVEDIRFLGLDNQNNLYAACDNGLFKTNFKDTPGSNKNSILEFYYKDEPKISEVQKAAIKYAEVEPEKIIRWRKQAAKRALLPKVTIDMDRDKDRTISNSIWGTYGTNSSPGKYYVGPDDETRYNNKNWGVSLTWELGDLIWNDDQTNIDVRSRLMVQLRDDILDEVTKLYFERIRVKMELDYLSIEDRKKRLEKELKVQELEASLDALTDGYFSRSISNYN